jgi:hypothetical protein
VSILDRIHFPHEDPNFTAPKVQVGSGSWLKIKTLDLEILREIDRYVSRVFGTNPGKYVITPYLSDDVDLMFPRWVELAVSRGKPASVWIPFDLYLKLGDRSRASIHTNKSITSVVSAIEFNALIKKKMTSNNYMDNLMSPQEMARRYATQKVIATNRNDYLPAQSEPTAAIGSLPIKGTLYDPDLTLEQKAERMDQIGTLEEAERTSIKVSAVKEVLALLRKSTQTDPPIDLIKPNTRNSFQYLGLLWYWRNNAGRVELLVEVKKAFLGIKWKGQRRVDGPLDLVDLLD